MVRSAEAKRCAAPAPVEPKFSVSLVAVVVLEVVSLISFSSSSALRFAAS